MILYHLRISCMSLDPSTPSPCTLRLYSPCTLIFYAYYLVLYHSTHIVIYYYAVICYIILLYSSMLTVIFSSSAYTLFLLFNSPTSRICIVFMDFFISHLLLCCYMLLYCYTPQCLHTYSSQFSYIPNIRIVFMDFLISRQSYSYLLLL